MTMLMHSDRLDVDMTSEVRCIVEEPEVCERPAKWVGVNLCSSRHQATVCHYHRQLARDTIKVGLVYGIDILCHACDDPLVPPYIEWRPL